MSTSRSRLRILVPVVALAVVAAACGSSGSNQPAASGSGGEKVTLRLGYFGNVTHAPAMVGLQDGGFSKALGSNVTLKTSVFSAGPAAVEALFGGSIDASFVGPNPAINAYAQSKGAAIRIVAGTASGGAFFVVNKDIHSAADLKGKKVGSPSLGNTQDVSLRYWLKQQGLSTDTNGGGDVHVVPGPDNGTVVTEFQTGAIVGAWMPEPYASKMIAAGGHVLVDEATLWPQGNYVTTLLIVRTAFLNAHPDVVTNLIKGLSNAIDTTNSDPAKAAELVSTGIDKATGKPLSTDLVTKSFKSITFSLDPYASTLRTDVAHAEALGILKATPSDQHLRPDPAQQVPLLGGEVHHRVVMTNVGIVERPSANGSAARADSHPAIRIDGVSKAYGHAGNAVVALDHLTLDVAPGEFVCLVGASGCGKSTLLNIVAGLDSPTQGSLAVSLGRPALMFQESALFPWLTVRKNIELALRLSKVSKAERRAQVDALLAMVHLDAFGDKKPHELSGGMRQRGALARALAQRRAGVADGRAVRRARRDDARHPARRARPAVAREQPVGAVRDAQRPRGRAPR